MLYINSVQFLILEEKYMETQERNYLTPRQVEELYSVKVKTLATWRYEDKHYGSNHLPYTKIGGKVLYEQSAIEKVLEANTHQPLEAQA